MKRQLLFFVCCLFATFGISTAFAQTTSTFILTGSQTLKYTVTSGTTVRVERYSNDNYGDLIIPSTVWFGGRTYTVTEIPADGFSNIIHRILTSVTVPNTVTTIGNYAFSLVGNVIYNGTASGSPWGALTVNGYVRDGFVYSDNTMTTLTAVANSWWEYTPNSVTSIGESAFADCDRLTSVTIPNSVRSISKGTFHG